MLVWSYWSQQGDPCRDIVEGLHSCGCTSTTHFEWQRQLRFEFDTALDDIVVQQVRRSGLMLLV